MRRPDTVIVMRRHLTTAGLGIALGAFASIVLLAAPASAHAIIDLDGVTAVAGRSSAMTLEIQHGCLPAEATTQVDA